MVLCGFVVMHKVEPQGAMVAGVSDETIVWTSPTITPVENWSR